jgi:hypothetical protein
MNADSFTPARNFKVFFPAADSIFEHVLVLDGFGEGTEIPSPIFVFICRKDEYAGWDLNPRPTD